MKWSSSYCRIFYANISRYLWWVLINGYSHISSCHSQSLIFALLDIQVVVYSGILQKFAHNLFVKLLITVAKCYENPIAYVICAHGITQDIKSPCNFSLNQIYLAEMAALAKIIVLSIKYECSIKPVIHTIH